MCSSDTQDLPYLRQQIYPALKKKKKRPLDLEPSLSQAELAGATIDFPHLEIADALRPSQGLYKTSGQLL